MRWKDKTNNFSFLDPFYLKFSNTIGFFPRRCSGVCPKQCCCCLSSFLNFPFPVQLYIIHYYFWGSVSKPKIYKINLFHSMAAHCVSVISTSFVAISIVGMTVSTLPQLQYQDAQVMMLRGRRERIYINSCYFNHNHWSATGQE